MAEKRLIEIRVTCFDYPSIEKLSDHEVLGYFKNILRKTNRRFLPKGVVFSNEFVSRAEDRVIIHLQHQGQETCRIHFVRLRRLHVAAPALALAE
ncbi:MAG: hypothetical protein JWM16_4252 [Verrucomicrobiales bacterium]|nr:hypothetical protein [Verrucomicrobiales bacterium]